MPLHETKSCPRCHQPFECKTGDICHCQCYGIALTEQERYFMEQRYSDCLCRKCLEELKNKPVLFTEKFFPK